jgi:PAS domain S-box-containing protein
MKHISFKYSDKTSLKNTKKLAQKDLYKTQLIQLFTALTDKKEIQKILQKLKKYFPKAHIIGTTTAGEISHSKMYDNTTVVSVSLFTSTKLQTAYVKNINKKSGEKISNLICSKKTKASIILSEGLHGEDYEGFIKGIKKQNPQLIIAGGLAGDNFLLEKTYIFLGTDIYENGAVGVSFSGKKLYATNKYNLNWTPIGKTFRITSSDGNLIHTIDNEPARKVFKRYLGAKVFENNAASLPDFQLLYKEGSTTVSRTPLAIDGDSLVFAAPIKENQVVQFGFSNASAVISGAQHISTQLAKDPAEAIYIFSCIARKTLLGKVLEHEFEAFDTIAPTAGFFTYGEFYSTNANNALLNCTTTILVLSEGTKGNKRKNYKKTKEQNKDLENVTFSALTHFIKQTSEELNSNIKLLNQYKSAVDLTSLVSKTDLDGNITYVNDNFSKVSKYTKEELLGNNHRIIRDKNMSPFIFKKMWQTITKGKVWQGLLSNRAKDGSIYYVDATVMPIYNKNDQIEEYIAIRQNVTKQIQSKRRIMEKEKLIKAIFDNQESIVIYASKTQGMLSVNKKLFEYFDYKNLEDFKAKQSCICDLFIEEEGYTYPSKHQNWLNDIAEGKTSLQKAKMKIKDGTIHTFNIVVKRLGDEYVINLNDITSLEDAIKKAHLSEQAKSTFLANMSHEIRPPLNGILGFTDILTKKELDKDAKRYVDIIHKSGETLLSVVNDILDFSKIESGELSLYEIEANLFEEMEASVSTFASVSKTKSIDYFVYIDTNIPKMLKCDIQRIKQVMNNLTSNAIKFTPEQGRVRLSINLQEIQEDRAVLRFSVKDSGIGIAKEKLSSIFNAFSQADNSISREFGGTGLGLAISSQYIRMMGSELKVESEEGKGSEFYFTLELPIINATQSFEYNANLNSITIKLLNSKDKIVCGINEIVATYLDAWQCQYEEIESIDMVDNNTDILITCAKIFDEEKCRQALNNFEKLQLIYVEGIEESFNCIHEKFHLIEQPMTGSALFDKLITLTNTKYNLVSEKGSDTEVKKFEGSILVAEDNETNQLLISIMLEEKGIQYKIVNNGQEAVDEALAKEYDIIFMDINMPILDGVSAIKILRKEHYTKPIISLSANVIEADILSFKEAGVDDTLNKPIVPKELDKILSNYLKSEDGQQATKLSFDTVDVEALCTQLAIPSETIIVKLLNSFAESITETQKNIEQNGLSSDIAHNIKGVAGNLRFTKLYELAMDIEKNISEWDEKKITQSKEEILAHLKHLQKEIKQSNK